MTSNPPSDDLLIKDEDGEVDVPASLIHNASEALYAYMRDTYHHAAGTDGPEDWVHEVTPVVVAVLCTLSQDMSTYEDYACDYGEFTIPRMVKKLTASTASATQQ